VERRPEPGERYAEWSRHYIIFRAGLVIGVECMFAWYGVADFCADQDIAFLLGHALYMKASRGGKAKNDRIDAGKLARLLRGGNYPPAYAYPKGMRETRDLLRRRSCLVHQRADLMTHVQILNAQYNLAPFPTKLAFAANRAEMNIAEPGSGRRLDATPLPFWLGPRFPSGANDRGILVLTGYRWCYLCYPNGSLIESGRIEPICAEVKRFGARWGNSAQLGTHRFAPHFAPKA
jgi:hypothetical protein